MRSSKSTEIRFWLTALLIGIVIFFLSNLGIFAQLQGWGLAISSGLLQPLRQIVEQVEYGADFLSNLNNIHSQNIELEGIVREQRGEISRLEILNEENAWLKKQVGIYAGGFQPPQILAQVIRYQYSPVAGYLFVYTPSALVSSGDFVIESNHIVGEVVEVLGYYAKIRLITAGDTKLSVQVSKQVGKLVGDAAVTARIEGINNTASVKEGTSVYLFNPTNPAAARFPLGKSGKKLSAPADATQVIEVAIPVDLANLQYLIVLHNDSK